MIVRPGRYSQTNGRTRTMWRAVVRAAAMLSLASRAATAQPAASRAEPERAPLEVARARLAADLFFRAVADERWDVAAAMVDTIAVRRSVAQRLRWRQEPARREMTVEDFMRDDPNKPRVVAEYELKRFREQSAKRDFDPIAYEFAGIRSAEELRSLSALEVTARYIQAQDFRVQMREVVRRSGCGVPAARVLTPFSVHRILATALAADTVAYVLHEDGMVQAGPDAAMHLEPTVMQLRLRGGSWRIVPTASLLRRSAMMGFDTLQCDSTARRPPD